MLNKLQMIISVIPLFISVLASIVCSVSIKKTKDRRKNISWLRKKRITIGIKDKEYDMECHMFLNNEMLKMNNSGTPLENETDRLIFMSIAKEMDICQ